jgi:hypothetical protein
VLPCVAPNFFSGKLVSFFFLFDFLLLVLRGHSSRYNDGCWMQTCCLVPHLPSNFRLPPVFGRKIGVASHQIAPSSFKFDFIFLQEEKMHVQEMGLSLQ